MTHCWVSTQWILIYNRDICIFLLVASLFTLAKKWNSPMCLLTGEWIMKIS